MLLHDPECGCSELLVGRFWSHEEVCDVHLGEEMRDGGWGVAHGNRKHTARGTEDSNLGEEVGDSIWRSIMMLGNLGERQKHTSRA